MMPTRPIIVFALLICTAILLAGCGGGGEPRRYYSRGFAVEISGAETLDISGGATAPEENDPRAYWQSSITLDTLTYNRVVRFEDPASGLTVELLGITTRSSDFVPEPAADGQSFAARVLTKDGKIYASNVDGFMRVDNVSFSSFSGDGGSLSVDNIKGMVTFSAQSSNGDTVEVDITIDDLPINIVER